jgi:hypothetical protein
LRRCGGFLQRDEIIQLHHLAGVVPYIQGFQIKRLVSVLPVQFPKYLVLLAVHDEIAEPLSAEGQLEGLPNILRGDAQQIRLIAVDLDLKFRFGKFQVDICHHKSGIVVHLLHEGRQDLP